MADLVIRFIIQMGEAPGLSGGPSFHRWLPDGIRDAIETNIDLGHLQLWFERRGYTERMVHFDFERHEVAASIVAKQGSLDAGPLLGRLHLANVPGNVVDALRQDQIGDPRS